MKGIKNTTKNYMNKLQSYATMHNNKALKLYRDKRYINSLFEVALANKAMNKKLTVLNHGKTIAYFEEDVMNLLVKMNKINYEDEDTFLINIIYAKV